ncbi:GNAT family N-acetyltransferase [Streptomyces noursei]
MFATSLGAGGGELRPLEPWQAEEFPAHIDRGREFIGRHNRLPDVITDLASSRAYLTSPGIAVARRLGMTREGVLRECYAYRGERHDMEIWSVLAPEWRAHRPSS